MGCGGENVCASRDDSPQLGAALQRAAQGASLPACNLVVLFGTPFPKLVKQRPGKERGLLGVLRVYWTRASGS